MDPKEGDNVRFKHKSVEITGTVIKRSGTHVRVQPKDGGATLWKELSELLPIAPAVDEASEVAELQRLFSSGLSSARANALSTRGVQATAKQTISERPNKLGMPAPVPKPAVGPLQAAPPDMKREVFEAAPPPHRPAIGPSRLNAMHDGGDTNLDGIDNPVAVAPQAAQAAEAEAEAEAEAKSAGERLAGMMRVRGGMGAGASALTVESPDADIKAAYEGASAQERLVFLDKGGEQEKMKLVSLGLIVPEAAPSGLAPGASSRLNAFPDGDDTNLDDIDDDNAVRPIGAPSELLASRTSIMEGSTPLPPKLRQALTELDKIVIQVLLSGAIRLLCVKWLLMQPANFKMPNRQALEEIERSGVSSSPLLSPQEAVALVERGDRSIGTLTYGWLSPGDPDPKSSRIRVLRRALMGRAIRIEALFWDFGSLYQAPRTSEQAASFKLALEGGAMNQLYASILATTVLQIKEIPPRPAEFDGVVCLFKLSANVDENMVRAALIGFGTIESCDLSHSPPIVRFASHLSAVKAKDAGVWPGLCEGLDTLYNETPYFYRGW
jgi:predicted DNA-binding ribbon-helix-helix protein